MRDFDYRAIRNRNADISFQLQDPRYPDYELEFVPLTTYPLLCVPVYTYAKDENPISLEQLAAHRIAFYFEAGTPAMRMRSASICACTFPRWKS